MAMSKNPCPLLNRKTKLMVLPCRYKGKLDFSKLGTIEHCVSCLHKHKRYINECFFLALKALRAKRDKLKKRRG